MKATLLGGLAALSLAGAATAADLPRRAAPPLLPPVPVFTWTGFYAGFNAGYAFDVGNNRANGFTQVPGSSPLSITAAGAVTNPAILTPGSSLVFGRNNNEGFSGGGQIGYNYQFTPGAGVVVGFEADAQYLDFGQRRRFAVVGGTGPAFGAFVPADGLLSTLDFFGTVRGRLGYAFDRTLIYATGGFAYATGDQGSRLAFQNFNNRRGDFVTGYTVGGGVEYAIPTGSPFAFLNFFNSSAVTLKVEGLYVNLDNGRRGLPLVGGLVTAGGLQPVFSNNNLRRDTEFAVVRAGVNYKFGTF